MIFLFNIAIPVALLTWLWRFPAASVFGFLLQATGSGLFLFALALVGQWAVPIWWLPLVYGMIWLMAARVVLKQRSAPRGHALWPTGGWGWASAAVGFMLACIGGWYGVQALSGRGAPPVEVVDLENPFVRGHFLVASGGSHAVINAHMRTLDDSVPRYRDWRGQSYAVDFLALGPWGLRAAGWRPADPAAYAIFGAPLVAPCAGRVVSAENQMPDNRVPQQDTVARLGNHVVLRCGEVEVVMAHMRQGSVTAAHGAAVEVGDPLGEVGNSGASGEPHLHIHAQRPASQGAPLISGAPLGIRIDGDFLVRGDRFRGRL